MRRATAGTLVWYSTQSGALAAVIGIVTVPLGGGTVLWNTDIGCRVVSGGALDSAGRLLHRGLSCGPRRFVFGSLFAFLLGTSCGVFLLLPSSLLAKWRGDSRWLCACVIVVGTFDWFVEAADSSWLLVPICFEFRIKMAAVMVFCWATSAVMN